MKSIYYPAAMRHLCVLSILAIGGTVSSQNSPQAYSGGTSIREVPDISILADLRLDLTDVENDPNDEKLRVSELELYLGGYITPTVRGDFVGAFEQDYTSEDEVETEVDVEEAYITFLALPGGLEVEAGRKLLDFGRLNPLHPHRWPFADTPLVLENLFGDHPWFDDGLTASWVAPLSGDIYLKLTAGAYNGRSLAHSHGEEDEHAHEEDPGEEHEGEEHAHEHGETIEWEGHIILGRAFLDLPLSDDANAQFGYTVAADEGGDTTIQGVDATLLVRWPDSYRKLRWQTEVISADNNEDADPLGLYSLVSLDLDKSWQVGGRYDWTEPLTDEGVEKQGAAAFLTYFLSESTYLRAQHRVVEPDEGKTENLTTVQLVWGIGPHTHRLED